MKTLKPFQETGVRFLASHPFAILADDMGLGKTVQALSALKQIKAKNVLYIVPGHMRETWEERAKEWFDPSIHYQCIYTSKDVFQSGHIILSYDMFHKKPIKEQIKKRQWDVFIMDEAHKLSSNLYSKKKKDKEGNVKSSISTLPSRTRHMLHKTYGIFRLAKYRWYLSGTPIFKCPRSIYQILKVECASTLGSYVDFEAFAYRYCDAYRTPFGINATGASNIEEFQERLRPHLLRRKYREVFSQLPEPLIENIYFRIPKKDVERIEREHIQTQKYEACIARYKESLDFIKDKLESVDNVLVFAFNIEIVDKLKADLKSYHPVTFYGQMNNKEKENAKKQFIEGNARVFIGNLQAAGQGVDGLQKVCHTAIIMQGDPTDSTMTQVFGRLDRMGQENRVIIYRLITKGTIDERMLDRCEKENKMKADILDPLTTKGNDNGCNGTIGRSDQQEHGSIEGAQCFDGRTKQNVCRHGGQSCGFKQSASKTMLMRIILAD